jgi:hypothetical protein
MDADSRKPNALDFFKFREAVVANPFAIGCANWIIPGVPETFFSEDMKEDGVDNVTIFGLYDRYQV